MSKIVVYSKPDCSHCVDTKLRLQELGITYEDVDISKDTAAKEFVVNEGHRTVPQIYINDKVVPGGNKAIQTMTVRQIYEWR